MADGRRLIWAAGNRVGLLTNRTPSRQSVRFQGEQRFVGATKKDQPPVVASYDEMNRFVSCTPDENRLPSNSFCDLHRSRFSLPLV